MILGTICCRAGSKGVIGKNWRPLNGVPLITYTIETAKKSQFLDDLILSTDDPLLIDIAKQNEVSVPFIRPNELATSKASKWPVFIHAVENYEKLNYKTVSFLVDMDVTVPLKTAQDIDNAIQLLLDSPHIDVVITGYEPERNPYFNMMEINKEGIAEIVKKTEQPIVRRQDAPKVFSLTPAAFVVRKEALYKYEHWSQAKCLISEMPRERAIDIDTEFDFKLIEFIMNGK
jgi:CMP-N,N'-diacetyllegionaminic acid synthase